MSLKSMTGFARVDGASGPCAWYWEARSVNGRGLDVRMRLPPGYDKLEQRVRDAVAKRISRGNVTVSLSAERRANVEVRLNEAALAQIITAANRVQELTGCERPRVEGLLALKGVLEVAETNENEEESSERHAAMLSGFEAVMHQLQAARAAEGERLAAVLRDQLATVERLVTTIEASPARTPAAITARIGEQVKRLMDTGNSFDPARLHQEAVLIATRADVEEELQRLRSHIAAARELLSEDGAVGRKFDFLAQEFNREANTLCSKSGDVEMTRAGLDLKVLIDQMREQVQNIE